jgi:hypothetical protein
MKPRIGTAEDIRIERGGRRHPTEMSLVMRKHLALNDGYGCFWHDSEVPTRLSYVGFRGQTGKHLLTSRLAGLTRTGHQRFNCAVMHNRAMIE